MMAACSYLELGGRAVAVANQRHDQDVVTLHNDFGAKQSGSLHPLEVGHLLFGPHLDQLASVLPTHPVLVTSIA